MGGTKSKAQAVAATTAGPAAIAAEQGAHALVVGGTAGIGAGIALKLAEAGINVTIAGRNKDRAEKVMKTLPAKDGQQHQFMQLDASLMGNLRAAARDYTQSHARLDYLVLCQGIATMQGRTETTEGIDVKLALHYYGRVALARELLPLMRQTHATHGGQPRVLSVLSGGVHAAYKLWREDTQLKNNYSLKNAADLAGFYNDLSWDAMARDPGNENVGFIHACPGFVDSEWGTDFNAFLRGVTRVSQACFARSTAVCADFMANALFSSEYGPGGFHVMDENGRRSKTAAGHTDEAREWVHDDTISLLDDVMGGNNDGGSTSYSHTEAAS